MSSAPTPQNEPKETELLVQFEIDNIPAEYREYYRIKRNNFFASRVAQSLRLSNSAACMLENGYMFLQ